MKGKDPAAWWICAALVLAIAAAYWPVGYFAFTLYDDGTYVSFNPHVLNGFNWSGVVWAFDCFYASNWHPLTWVSLMLDAQIYGSNAGGYHLTNLVFHAANTVLLFLWLRRLTGFLWRSALVAALFGLHPLHVESVAWVAERKDVLSTFFLMLSLMAYTRYAQRRVTGDKGQVTSGRPVVPSLVTRHSSLFYWLSLFCFALGLLSKPMVVTLPFVLLLLDYWPLQRMQNAECRMQNFIRLVVEKIPFLVLSAGSCVVTFLAQHSSKAMMSVTMLPVGARIENALIAYASYLEKMLWPEKLAACYPLLYSPVIPIDSDNTIVAASVLLLISCMVLIFWRQKSYLVTGWLWYLGMLVPVIGLVQVGSQAMADRYTYVPLIGIFIAIVWLVAETSIQWPSRRLVLATLSVAMLAACWKLTAAQVRVWQNSETLARHALAVTDNNVPMQDLLGYALLDQGKISEADQHFAEAVRIWPEYVPLQLDLALALVAQAKYAETIETCRTALKFEPRNPKIHYLMGKALAEEGKFEEAMDEYKVVLQIDPKQIYALNDLAWLLATAPVVSLRNGSEAVRLAEQACRFSRYKVTMYVGTLGAAYAEAGRFDDAIKTAKNAIALAKDAKNYGLASKNRELLELYQHHQSYHESTRH